MFISTLLTVSADTFACPPLMQRKMNKTPRWFNSSLSSFWLDSVRVSLACFGHVVKYTKPTEDDPVPLALEGHSLTHVQGNFKSQPESI